MNLSTILMLLAAWQLLSNNKSNSKGSSIADFLSSDTQNMLHCVDKITSQKSSQEDRTGAILQMISNPAVMELASKLFAKNTAPKTSTTEQQTNNSYENNEGYTFEEPSKDSKDFFKPIENIADAEVKHKLYWFYDNWYVKQ